MLLGKKKGTNGMVVAIVVVVIVVVVGLAEMDVFVLCEMWKDSMDWLLVCRWAVRVLLFNVLLES